MRPMPTIPTCNFPLLGAQRSASPHGDRSTLRASMNVAALSPRIGIVTEAFANRPLVDVMDWLVNEAASVNDLEVGTGGYAPTGHCDLNLLLHDSAVRKAWLHEISTRGLAIGAFNVWGNPLHPDAAVAKKHDADLRDTIRLAAMLGVDRVVALAGCPPGARGDRTPHFAGGGWLPYLEDIHEGQWESVVEPYWLDIAEFATEEHPQLLVCLELHPGTVVYNVETFERIAGLGDAIAANIDPSHFFWMGMDPIAVIDRIGDRAGHCHGKDVVFAKDHLAVNGLLDRRWPKPPDEMPWNFAVVGRGKPQAWWDGFVGALVARGRVHTIAIEHEDPFVPAEAGVPEAAEVLAAAVRGLGC
ncbi:MAG: sugar phosphate isomerase/epimerase [Chloroflexi bacterium]|nr:MAG: sugar phosphate isomerase/epimerase [Chloroflexota bacterium]